MDRTSHFRNMLAARLIQVAGFAALAGPAIAAGCGGNVVVDPEGGSGGSGGAQSTSSNGTSTGDTSVSGTTTTTTAGQTGSTSSTSTGTGAVYECFTWDVDPPCPPADQALPYLQQNDCMDPDYIITYEVVSGPEKVNAECCYYVLQSVCGVGRPFLVEGRPRVAAARAGGPATGWASSKGKPSIAGLSASEREALAAAWAGDGLLEHASVASFSRFSLDLMAAGAPADLVEAAHLAALDEIRHTRLCLALASVYRGAAIEPGPLACDGALPVIADLPALAAAAAREGCVGETIAAVIAAEQLAAATDPAVREALAVIARDEARHAELAFRTVAWAIRAGGEAVRAAVAAVFDEAARDGVDAGGVEADPGGTLAAHGRLTREAARAAAARALADVVLPCGRALLE